MDYVILLEVGFCKVFYIWNFWILIYGLDFD